VKRFMGRKFDEVRAEEHRVPYKLVKAANGDAHPDSWGRGVIACGSAAP
jgi:hypothetical protein